MGLSMGFVFYNIINLPFSDAIQNYRANIVHITHFITLLVTNYYRSMKSTTSLEVKARLHIAAKLEISMIVICVIVSFLVLVYEIIKLFKEIYRNLKNKKI